MRFSVLAEYFGGFAVLDDFFFGFAVSNIPQCPPRSSLFTNKRVNHSITVLIRNLKFFFGPINYIHDVYYSRCFKFRKL